MAAGLVAENLHLKPHARSRESTGETVGFGVFKLTKPTSSDALPTTNPYFPSLPNNTANRNLQFKCLRL